MPVSNLICKVLGTLAVTGISAALFAAERPPLPRVSPLLQTRESHPFSASMYQKRPLDLSKLGYVEEEYLVSGKARVFDWPLESGSVPRVISKPGPYTTRILVRRPKDPARFNGTVIIEPFNPSESVDLPIMWAQSYAELIAEGYAWVGVTIKPNDIKSLQAFDPGRYARLAMPDPRSIPGCATADINASSQPTTPADETGLAWDMLSQIGALFKSAASRNPLHKPAARLYMTGQSQTAGYARTYAAAFARGVAGPDGKQLYDGYIYSGSPPWQVPLNQCRKDLPPGDPRLITPAVGVPIIEIFTQGDMQTNVETRRADADTPEDRFRRYEVAGAAHVDAWEELSFASDADMARAHHVENEVAERSCIPSNVTTSNFPVRYVFDAAWDSLDAWVRHGVPAPHAKRLELKDSAAPLPPDQAFVTDVEGNARGGLRTPYVDVPTARWIGAKTGPFICLFHGYRFDLDKAELGRLYGSHQNYVDRVTMSARELQAARWLTRTDANAIIQEARRASVP